MRCSMSGKSIISSSGGAEGKKRPTLADDTGTVPQKAFWRKVIHSPLRSDAEWSQLVCQVYVMEAGQPDGWEEETDPQEYRIDQSL